MSDEVTGAGGGDASGSAPEAASAAGSTSESVSAGDGNAPVAGVDAGAEGGGDAQAPQLTAAQFQFLNRQFRDQKHAETALNSELQMVKGLQRQNAELTKAKAQYEARVAALEQMVAGRPAQIPGQGVPQGPQGPGGPRSGLEAMLSPERFHFYQKLSEDPEIGLAGAMFAQQQDLVKAVKEEMETLKSEAIQPIVQRNEQAQAIAKVFGAAKQLAASGYPELDNDNRSPEAEEAQQQILSILQEIPADYLRANPERALRMAVLEYRERNGTPIFAQQPGTSGSPSVRAAMAAEAAAPGLNPLDGSGTPRPRQGGPETPADRIRRENREATVTLRSEKGRPLGFQA